MPALFLRQLCPECQKPMWPSKVMEDGWYCPDHGKIHIRRNSNHAEAVKETWGTRRQSKDQYTDSK